MDWAGLNPDLLQLVAKKVRDIFDFIRFRAVCKHWRTNVHPADLPPQFPYFIEFTKKNDSSVDIMCCSLFSEKSHTWPGFQIPPLKGELILFSSLTGYVLLTSSQSSTLLLINPLTGFQVPLPFIIDKWYYALYFGPSHNPRSNPIEKNIDLVIEFDDTERPSFAEAQVWRYADRKWTKICKVSYSQDEFVRYTNGRLYIFSVSKGDIRVIDINNGDMVSLIPESFVRIHYVINDQARGGLLGVHRHTDIDAFFVDVYQLKDAEANPHWVKLNGLGDRMMFFDSYDNSLCLEAGDFEGCKGGWIYTLDSLLHKCVVRLDTENSTEVKLLPEQKFQWSEPHTNWFVPSLL